MEGMHRVALPRVLRPLTRVAFARAALVGLATMTVMACAAGGEEPEITSIPTFGRGRSPAATTRSTTIAVPQASSASTDEIPDAPTTTSAVAIPRPQRGASAPVGAIVFGADLRTAPHVVSVVDEQTTFAAGDAVAWRVTLPAATGGESVRVMVTTEDDTEMVVDRFVAQAGWNVYYGKSVVTVAPGMYVLHYFVDGHEVGSGTFSVEQAATGPTTQTSVTPTATTAPTTI
jgi:hypothetical protein